ncbi:hypothetical protein CLV35_2459 [Motilibacter peucedani]|uniref:Uncharacterized protein n=1 Tax=Motilibacter peucedani TaxID=598650 RepID=A0A420XP33_9ACTN|nr:hypothetical protein [Motilibacter peucedani]RKS73963.1 hypothetical protein CLV35_2459 [Motilibacter peucedani]
MLAALALVVAACALPVWWTWPREGSAAALVRAERGGAPRSVEPGGVQRLGPWWRLEADPLSDSVVWQDRWWRTRTVPRDAALERALALPRRSPADDDYVFGRLVELRRDGVHGSSAEVAVGGLALVATAAYARRRPALRSRSRW